MNIRRMALASAFLAGLVTQAPAQVTTGSITGAVADESGGVVPGATVAAVHEETGARSSAVNWRARSDIVG